MIRLYRKWLKTYFRKLRKGVEEETQNKRVSNIPISQGCRFFQKRNFSQLFYNGILRCRFLRTTNGPPRKSKRKNNVMSNERCRNVRKWERQREVVVMMQYDNKHKGDQLFNRETCLKLGGWSESNAVGLGRTKQFLWQFVTVTQQLLYALIDSTQTLPNK